MWLLKSGGELHSPKYEHDSIDTMTALAIDKYSTRNWHNISHIICYEEMAIMVRCIKIKTKRKNKQNKTSAWLLPPSSCELCQFGENRSSTFRSSAAFR